MTTLITAGCGTEARAELTHHRYAVMAEGENPQKLARRAQSKGNAAFFDGKYEDAIAE